MAQSPNATPPAKQAMFILIGAAGLILLGGGGLLAGLNSRVTGQQTVAQQKEAEVGSSEQIAKRYQTTLDNYNDTQSRMKFLETSVSGKAYVPTLLGQLQSLAAATHLTVTAVRPTTPPPPPAPVAKPASADGSGAAIDAKKPVPPPYDTLNIDVETIGTYADTATFLYSLTRFPKILSVTGAQMHPNALAIGASPTASPTVTTSLKLVAFVFPDDGTGAAALAGAVTPGMAGAPTTVVPAASAGTIAGAAGRAATGAVAATHAANDQSASNIRTL